MANSDHLLLPHCYLQGMQNGIAPRMFKSLIGKGHPEFSTNRQQDAQEFFLHFINMVEVMVESIWQIMEKSSLIFFPQQGMRSGGEKLAIGAERREHRETGHLAPDRVEKERCLAIFSGLIAWRNLFWEWHSWRCKLCSLGAGMPWLPGVQKLALVSSLLSFPGD